MWCTDSASSLDSLALRVGLRAAYELQRYLSRCALNKKRAAVAQRDGPPCSCTPAAAATAATSTTGWRGRAVLHHVVPALYLRRAVSQQHRQMMRCCVTTYIFKCFLAQNCMLHTSWCGACQPQSCAVRTYTDTDADGSAARLLLSVCSQPYRQ